MELIYQYIREFGIALFNLMEEMSPYLLLGFLFAGILYIWFPKNKVYKYLGKSNSISVLNAALIGIPLPLCSCGVIPTGISFYKSGASKGSSVSFLISTPQTGVDSIMVSYSLLGLPIAILKPIIALFTGLLGGILTNIFGKDDSVNKIHNNKLTSENNSTNRSLLGMLRYAFIEFLEDIAKWLVIGLLIAAFIDVIIPDSFFTSYLGNEYIEMLLILVAAIPLYVCATGSVPIAAILMLKGLSPGAAIVFLMAGPATNAATITVIGKVLGKRTLFIYLISIILGALFFGLIVNNFLPREWFINGIRLVHEGVHKHELIPQWFQYSTSIILSLLILNALFRRYGKNLFSSLKQPQMPSLNNNLTMKHLNILVKGMTCNHCKSVIEENIVKLPGIKNVEADLTSGSVKLTGEDLNLDQIIKKIESLGYKYDGLVE